MIFFLPKGREGREGFSGFPGPIVSMNERIFSLFDMLIIELIANAMCYVLNLCCGCVFCCRERWENLEREDVKESLVLRFLCGCIYYSVLMRLQCPAQTHHLYY